jgi:hypothetical protein
MNRIDIAAPRTRRAVLDVPGVTSRIRWISHWLVVSQSWQFFQNARETLEAGNQEAWLCDQRNVREGQA